MRHLSRAHRASVAWFHGQHSREQLELDYVSTDVMAADIFAKSTHVPAKLLGSRKLINVFESMGASQDAVCLHRPKIQATVVACLCSQLSVSNATPPQSAGDRADVATLFGNMPPMAQVSPQAH